jgi:hypothetical protein
MKLPMDERDQRSVVMLGAGSSGGMPIGVAVRLYWPGVEKNITIYKG